MATLTNKLQSYAKDNTNPSMAEFLKDKHNKIALLDFITQYDTAETAEIAVKRKCQVVYKGFLSKKNAYDNVHWSLLLEQAKLRRAAVQKATKVISAAVDEAANEVEQVFTDRDGDEGEGHSSAIEVDRVEERADDQEELQTDEQRGDQLNTSKKRKHRHQNVVNFHFSAGPRPSSQYVLANGDKLGEKWHEYKEQAVAIMEREGLYLAADLHEILALSHIFLVNPNHHTKLINNVIGTATIKAFHKSLKEKYVHDLHISDKMLTSVQRVLRNITTESTRIMRRQAELELLALSEQLDELEGILIDVIRGCIRNLPSTPSSREIREMELITKYLDPVLGAMLNQPDRHKNFRWLNQQVVAYASEETNLRPDAIVSLDPVRQETFALGYCEVKASAADKRYQDTHLDTLRTALFCKDTLDRGNVKCTLGVQAVESEALYPFLLLEKFDVPASLESLANFVIDLDKCKRILKVYEEHCIERSQSIPINHLRPTMPIEQLSKVLNTVVPKNFLPVLDFK